MMAEGAEDKQDGYGRIWNNESDKRLCKWAKSHKNKDEAVAGILIG